MNITTIKYEELSSLGDSERYLISFKDHGGKQRTLSVSCSGTLKSVWGIESNAKLFEALYPLVRNEIIRILSRSDRALNEIFPLQFSTYNAPQKPPKKKYKIPDKIKISIPKAQKTGHSNLFTRVTVASSEQQISFLGYDIANSRDKINSIIKKRHKFKLFYIEQERTIVDMYLPCKTEDEFTRRILALRNLLNWIDKKEIKEKLKKKINKKDGSVFPLEKFLEQEYPGYDKEQIVNKLKSVRKITSQYPIHQDSTKVLTGYEELDIKYPIENYRETWEKILKIYDDSLKELLSTITMKCK